MKHTHYHSFLVFLLGLISFHSSAQCNFFLPDAANFNRTGQSSVSNYTYTLADQFFSSGAAWYRDSADLTHDFDISFSTYQCGTADGMVFVLQSCTNGLNALGDNGWGMGYYGNTAVFTNSLGVELDIYNNGPDFQDTNNSHIVITRDGQNVPVADPVYISPALGSCGTRTLQLTWNATSHLFSVYVDDTLRTSYTADLVNDVFAGNPHVYFGFTGSGSADFATQQFTVNYLHYQPSHVHTQTATINSTSQCAGGTLSVSPGASAYLWSTGDTTNIISNASPGTYSITVTDHGGCTQSAQYTVDTAPGDPAIFGDHIWNIYAWNAGNSSGTAGAWSDNYTGYYTEPNLTFSTWDRWPTYSSPSDASGYQGCAVSPDNHSYSAKRKAFTCGIYQVDIYAHSQAAELFINGSKVWEHDGANDSHINVWTGFLDNNSTVEYRVSAGEGYSYAGIQIISVTDLITLNGPATICPGYNLQLTAVTTNPPYLWSTGDTTKSISVNATGTYSVSIATGSCPVSDSVSITVQPIPTPTIQVNGQNPAYSCNPWFGLSVANFSNSHTYHWSDGSTTSANGAFYTVNLGDYTVVATDVLGCKSDTSLTVTLSTIPPPGDPAVFGDHVWNQYVWKSTNWSDNYSGYDVFSQDYPDAILYQNLSKWSASPSNSQTYQGCSPGEDNFSWNAKRRGFPSNIYQIDINHHDDDAELYVNGTLVWSEAGAAYDNVNVWTGCLGENSTVELRVKEFSGIQRADMRMTPKITIITPNGPPAICPGFTEILTAPDSASSYLWSTGDTTQSISVSDSGTYTVIANMNGCPLTASRTIAVAPIQTPSITVSGMNPYYSCNTPPQLEIVSPISYLSYNWSNGTAGNSTAPAGAGDYTVTAGDVLGCVSDTSAVYTLSTTSPPGDPTVFGDHLWNVYAYSTGNASADSTAWQPSSYSGYYVHDDLSFDTQNSWYWNPSDVYSYTGCRVPDDNHSWSAKRKGFPCSIYQLDVPAHDDEAQLFVDGIKVWEHDGASDSHLNVWTGWLNETSEVEFRVTEGGGTSYGALTLNPVIFYADADGDGYGDVNHALSPCGASMSGYVGNSTDCNDAVASIHPGADDILFDGIDNNCNGSTDEPCSSASTVLALSGSSTLYRAPNPRYKSGRSVYLLKKSELIASGLATKDILKSIGWNNTSLPDIAASGTLKLYLQNTSDSVYTKPIGLNAWTTSIAAMSIVFNDTTTLPADTGFWSIDISDSAFKYTGNGLYVATEWINCGVVSGSVSQQISSGSGLATSSSNAAFCNPSTTLSSSTVRPVTRFSALSWWYLDADGDGYAVDSLLNCTLPATGWVSSVTGSGDCNDGNAAINPAVTEICNTTDDNCDGQIDEGIPTTTFYADADNDTYGNPGVTILACAAPSGYVSNNTDCNDNTGTIHPGANDVCNSIDDDCNSVVDDHSIVASIISPTSNVTECKGTVVSFAANTGAGLSYQWLKNGVAMNGATNGTYTTKQSGTYQVMESNSFGCSGISSGILFKTNPKPKAVLVALGDTNICTTGSVTLQANFGAHLHYAWYRGNDLLAGASTNEYTTTQRGTFTCIVSNNNGCSKTSNSIKVTKICDTKFAVNKQFDDAGLNLYPNPTTGKFTIDLQLSDTNDEDITVMIVNMMGQIVITEETTVVNGTLEKEMDLPSSVAAGVYWIRVIDKENIYQKKIVVQY